MLTPELQAKVTKITDLKKELLKEVFEFERVLQDKLSPAFESKSQLTEEEKELNKILSWLNDVV